MPGPAPKPTALKELAGNPGRRPLNKREPKPKAKLPPPPAGLNAEERKAYRRTGHQLLAMGVMTVADGTALATLAAAENRYWQAKEQVDKLGTIVKTTNGNLIQNPYLPVMNKAWEQMMKLFQEFGLTPSSRTRIQTMAEPQELSIADVLFSDVMEMDTDG